MIHIESSAEFEQNVSPQLAETIRSICSQRIQDLLKTTEIPQGQLKSGAVLISTNLLTMSSGALVAYRFCWLSRKESVYQISLEVLKVTMADSVEEMKLLRKWIFDNCSVAVEVQNPVLN